MHVKYLLSVIIQTYYFQIINPNYVLPTTHKGKVTEKEKTIKNCIHVNDVSDLEFIYISS